MSYEVTISYFDDLNSPYRNCMIQSNTADIEEILNKNDLDRFLEPEYGGMGSYGPSRITITDEKSNQIGPEYVVKSKALKTIVLSQETLQNYLDKKPKNLLEKVFRKSGNELVARRLKGVKDNELRKFIEHAQETGFIMLENNSYTKFNPEKETLIEKTKDGWKKVALPQPSNVMN